MGYYCLNRLRRAVATFVLAAFWLAQVIPVLPAAAFGEFTIKDEMELGRKFNVLIKSRMPLVQDPEVVRYLDGIVQRMVKTMPPRPYPFTMSVLRHNAVNAFATPGGYVFIHTGLILAMEHESEVAGVLGHELAHVTQRHIASRIEKSQWISILSLLGVLAGAFLGGEAGEAAMAGSMAGAQAAMLNYSRTDENEADQVGMNYLVKAGYPPSGLEGAFAKMSKKQWLMGGNIPSYLSTHPGLVDRMHDMALRVRQMPATVQNRKEDDTRFIRVQALVRGRYSDPDQAARAFAAQLNGPYRCMALMGQGILASRQNRINDAREAFDAALTCAPQDELIVREAGIFHYMKGNREKGVQLLEKAVKMDRDDIMAQFYYARVLADAGRTAEAADAIRLVMRDEPEDPELHEYLARYLAQQKQMFKANLHMAYAALYNNDEDRTEKFREKASNEVKTPQDKQELERFDTQYKERKQYWR